MSPSKFLLRKTLMFTLLCIFTSVAFANPPSVKITWSNPDDYKDIRASSGESEQTFRQRLAGNIQDHMNKLATDLAAGSVLEMTVTNLTLAGDLRTSGARSGHKDIRIVKDGYRARMSFSYQLLDAAGQVTKQGEEKLQSPLSGPSINPTSKNEPFAIEKKMLSRWFNKTIK